MKTQEASHKTIWLLAKAYVTNPRSTFEQIGTDYGLTREMVSNILWRGISENILSSPVAEAIYAKVVKSFKTSSQQRCERWDEAFRKREEIRHKINERLALCQKLHSTIQYCLEHYDEYSSCTPTPHSKEVLCERLENVNKRIARCKLALR